MKKYLILILAASVAFSACSVSRRVSVSTESVSPWVGCETTEILDAMGSPGRINPDGEGGSILVYESTPDYTDPAYDILDPDASARHREYAYFYLDDEGTCYRVETNRTLPQAPVRYQENAGGWENVLDFTLLIPLILLLEIL